MAKLERRQTNDPIPHISDQFAKTAARDDHLASADAEIDK
jgi:hypothetical protein